MNYYLLTEYKEKEKAVKIQFSKLGVWYKIRLFLLILLISFYSIYSIYKNNAVISLIGLAVVILVSYLWIKDTERNISKKYGSDLERHKIRIDILRGILRKHKLYSEPQVKYLIDLNNEQKENWKFSSSILKPFPVIFTSVLIPTLTIVLKWIIDTTKNKNDAIIYTALIITSLLLLLGFGFMMKPLIEGVLDKEYVGFKTLQELLQDIYLIDFAKEKA